ncbi:MAG: hypothetical protein HUU15_05110 [Candidatus Brocadiae bacterium]|nr:hypothetical protein [Candidatus Brocadiia bacterium]
MSAHFPVPLSLSHAATVSLRIARQISRHGPDFPPEAEPLFKYVGELTAVLSPYMAGTGDPPEAEGQRTAETALRLGRRIVEQIVELKWGEDRLGQCVRNLFESLEHGEEGAALGLRAGESPDSAQRPTP